MRLRPISLLTFAILLAAVLLGALRVPLGAAPAPTALPVPPGYADSLRVWRAKREARLRSETGWLTIAGLTWLVPGENRFGTAPDNAVVLPEGSAPAHAGTFVLAGGPAAPEVTVRFEAGVEGRVGGAAVREARLADDASGKADVVSVGRLKLWIIRRGDKLGVRLRDPESPLRRDFRGIDFFPPDPSFRVMGRLERTPRPRGIAIADRVGVTDTVLTPGPVTFTLDGKALSLYPTIDDSTSTDLFFVFGDATNGVTTYGAGRFLAATVAPGDSVLLDFNLAYNPPCAFNPYTTCPLPPEGNVLPVPVRAGEEAYDEEGH